MANWEWPERKLGYASDAKEVSSAHRQAVLCSCLRPGDEQVTLDIETEMSLRPMRGVVHANPRSSDDRERFRRTRSPRCRNRR